MKKINLIRLEFAVLFLLILIPFVVSYDVNVTGFDPNSQNMCGDGFCQPTETVTSCPADCTSPQPLPSGGSSQNEITSNTSNNISPETQNNLSSPIPSNNFSSTQGNVTTSSENVPAKNVFFVSTTFKIILGLVILLVLAAIIYLLIRSKNKNKQISSPQLNQ